MKRLEFMSLLLLTTYENELDNGPNKRQRGEENGKRVAFDVSQLSVDLEET